MPDANRRAQIAAAVACGRLPPQLPKTAWGGMGSGLPCSLCGKSIDPDHVETEFEDQGEVYRMHLECMTAWEAVTLLGAAAPAPALQVLVADRYSPAGDFYPEPGSQR
jgi:hypothetical protein